MVSLKTNPLLISPNLLACLILLALVTPSVVDIELPHPPDGTLRDRATNGINTGMLNKETKPPPTIFNIHQKLNNNGMVYKDSLIFNFNGKDIKWKFQSIVPYDYKGSKCNVSIEWENGETTNELLKVIGTDDPVTCPRKTWLETPKDI
jgi:hypothetical protein